MNSRNNGYTEGEIMKYHIRVFNIIMFFLLTFCVIGCGTDDEDTEPTNNSPIVDSFIVPEEFNPGDVLEFKVIAHDEDGDTLSYTWDVDGELLESTGTSAKWTALDDVESVKVTVYISDGVSKTVKRVKIITNKKFTPPDRVDPSDGEIDAVPDPPLNLIVPGKGAFGVKLGDPFKKVEEIHGEADGPIGVDRHFSYWDDPDLGFSGLVDGIGLVEDIFIRRPNKAKTAGNNGIGSALDSVKKEYGNAEKVDKDEFGGISHWYWKRGIKFTIDEDEKVDSIYVFKPIAGAPAGVGVQDQQNRNAQKNAAMRLQRHRTLQSSPSDKGK